MMDDGIQYFCNTSSIIRNSYISIISQNGNQKLHLLREGSNLVCMTVSCQYLYIIPEIVLMRYIAIK